MEGMDFVHADIEREYERWKEIIGTDDPYYSDETVGLHNVLSAHFLIVDYFAEKNYGIGGIGPRSVDLLHSALSRQFTGYDGVRKWKGLYETSATLLFGLIMNHPFHDANKRTALLAILYLLHRKKYVIELPQKKLDALVVAIAENTLESYFEKDARHLRKLELLGGQANTDATIHVVADFFRRNTRRRDDSARTVTYSQLSRALKRHGCELRHPSGNYINVVRIEPAKAGGFLGIGARPEREIYLDQIGFPGWKDRRAP
jgi:death-on-curing protein